ncbi:MAG TPA: AarF/UbiB family protein [Chloroflexia bacterium]|nr:AarF/UbiB family protein [Chloroflexia bacterium]
MESILEQTTRRTLQETGETLLPHKDNTLQNGVLYPAQLLTQLGDVSRSNLFLWTEASLRLGERLNRLAPVGLPVSRSLVLATVAADLLSGYLTLQQRSRWLPWLVSSRDWELQHERGANRLLDTAASLGGALIKAGQFASTRPDLLPAIYIQRLSRLQDNMTPLDWPTIQQAMLRELGRPLEEVFSRVEHSPVAAASLAQVHRAWLKDGRAVAVKILYPQVKQLVEADLKMLSRAADTISRISPNMQLQSIVEFLKETLPLELNLRREAVMMEELREALAHREDVIVPASFPEFSTERMLVMEFIEGIKVTERSALEAAGINPSEVVRLLNELYAEQVFQNHLLHADPHPGNLLVQPGPRIVILDHGLTVRLTPAMAKAMGDMVKALVEGDFDALGQALSSAGLKLVEGVDVITLLQVVGVIFGAGENKDVVEVGTKLGTSVGQIPVDLLLVGRALGMLNGIGLQLDPEQDTLETVVKYV